MKRIVICLAFVMLLSGASFAQTKTLTGTVINYSQGNKGNWETIDVKTADKTYLVYILSVDYPAAKLSGTVKQAGRTVKVFYTRNIAKSGDYAGDVIATKVVEIRKPKAKKNK